MKGDVFDGDGHVFCFIWILGALDLGCQMWKVRNQNWRLCEGEVNK